jgi:hypothetical protein
MYQPRRTTTRTLGAIGDSDGADAHVWCQPDRRP